MEMNEYQKAALRTRNESLNWHESVHHMLLMLSSEVGEITSGYQKFYYQGHECPEPEETAKELGDLLWPIANLIWLIGYDMDEIAQMNIDKLKARFPEGFNEQDSINRVDI